MSGRIIAGSSQADRIFLGSTLLKKIFLGGTLIYDQTSIIESIQQVEIAIGTGNSSNTGTISSVDTDRTILVPGGYRSTESGGYLADQDSIRVSLTNSTTITAQTNTANSDGIRTIIVTAVQFTRSAVRQVQRGTITVAAHASNTEATATLGNTVNTSNSAVIHLGQTTTESAREYGPACTTLQLTDGNTVTATRGAADSTDSVTVSYEVVEFDGTLIKNVQQISDVIGDGATENSTTTAITSAVEANCMLFWGGQAQVTSPASGTRNNGYVELTNATTLTFTRNNSTAIDTRVNVTVVEFNPNILNTSQRGVSTIEKTDKQQAETISPEVNSSFAVANYLGFSTSYTGTEVNNSFISVEISSSAQLVAKRGVSAAIVSARASFEVIEFVQ